MFTCTLVTRVLVNTTFTKSAYWRKCACYRTHLTSALWSKIHFVDEEKINKKSPVSFSLNLTHPFHLHRYCLQQALPCEKTRKRQIQTTFYVCVPQKAKEVHGTASTGQLSIELITEAPEGWRNSEWKVAEMYSHPEMQWNTTYCNMILHTFMYRLDFIHLVTTAVAYKCHHYSIQTSQASCKYKECQNAVKFHHKRTASTPGAQKCKNKQ